MDVSRPKCARPCPNIPFDLELLILDSCDLQQGASLLRAERQSEAFPSNYNYPEAYMRAQTRGAKSIIRSKPICDLRLS